MTEYLDIKYIKLPLSYHPVGVYGQIKHNILVRVDFGRAFCVLT